MILILQALPVAYLIIRFINRVFRINSFVNSRKNEIFMIMLICKGLSFQLNPSNTIVSLIKVAPTVSLIKVTPTTLYSIIY